MRDRILSSSKRGSIGNGSERGRGWNRGNKRAVVREGENGIEGIRAVVREGENRIKGIREL